MHGPGSEPELGARGSARKDVIGIIGKMVNINQGLGSVILVLMLNFLILIIALYLC